MNTRRVCRKALAVGLAAALVLGPVAPVMAAETEFELPDVDWSFEGIFGTFDRGQLQRGFKVYQEVCASCHSMDYLSYRNLDQPGGPGFTEEQVKAIAATVQVTDGPDRDGEMFQREGRPSDTFVAPFPNENAARVANGGALPPDLSVMAKARAGGADYLYALLTSYGKEPPADLNLQPGTYYNPAFEGSKIAMPPPLFEGQVEFDDDTSSSIENMAKDVTAFMVWAAEPKLEARKRMGFNVIIYLIILAGLLYFTTRKLWSGLKKQA